MQRYIGRIIRALIVSTLGFGGGTGLLIFIAMLVMRGYEQAFQYGLHAGLILGGIFGFMLVGVLLPLDLSAHLFHKKGNYKELWELEQAREVSIEGSFKDVVALCRKALLSVPYITTVTEDLESMSLKGSVGTSWRSFGEKMEVKIAPASDNRWNVRCTSVSPSKNVVFDYGKNFDNVETWLRHVQQLQESQHSQVA